MAVTVPFFGVGSAGTGDGYKSMRNSITENPRVRKSGAVWDRTGLMKQPVVIPTE